MARAARLVFTCGLALLSFVSPPAATAGSVADYASDLGLLYVVADVPLSHLVHDPELTASESIFLQPTDYLVNNSALDRVSASASLLRLRVVSRAEVNKPIAHQSGVVKVVLPLDVLDHDHIIGLRGAKLIPTSMNAAKNEDYRGLTAARHSELLQQLALAAEGQRYEIAAGGPVYLNEAQQIWTSPPQQNEGPLSGDYKKLAEMLRQHGDDIYEAFVSRNGVAQMQKYPAEINRDSSVKSFAQIILERGGLYFVVPITRTQLSALSNGETLPTENLGWYMIGQSDLGKPIPGFETYGDEYFKTHNPVDLDSTPDSKVALIFDLQIVNRGLISLDGLSTNASYERIANLCNGLNAGLNESVFMGAKGAEIDLSDIQNALIPPSLVESISTHTSQSFNKDRRVNFPAANRLLRSY